MTAFFIGFCCMDNLPRNDEEDEDPTKDHPASSTETGFKTTINRQPFNPSTHQPSSRHVFASRV
jgi:hypothetical protein